MLFFAKWLFIKLSHFVWPLYSQVFFVDHYSVGGGGGISSDNNNLYCIYFILERLMYSLLPYNLPVWHQMQNIYV